MKHDRTSSSPTAPLADRMRPRTLEEFLGQEALVGKGTLLAQAIASDRVPSMIFWGPPGSGKTTLAHIIAAQTQSEFHQLSAVASGVKELRVILAKAEEKQNEGRRTVLFIDEIHRWSKTQQDALLPFVEQGIVTLIGATTENPSFEVRSALLSRCRVIVLTALSAANLVTLLKRALTDEQRGLGKKKITISEGTLGLLANMSNGDARTALNVLDYAASISSEIASGLIKEAFQKSHLLYDKEGEEHYNIISALHKSMRGSNPDAALYWLARMLEAGEDPLYIARRLVRFASEDVGLANSRALEQAVAAFQACHVIGMPECNVILAQVVVYLAKCKKSNQLYAAYRSAADDVKRFGNLPVPLHLRNAPTDLMKELRYGKDYKYSPDFEYTEEQEYFPDQLKGKTYLNPRINKITND